MAQANRPSIVTLRMSLLACYRRTWAEVYERPHEYHLRIKAAPDIAVPEGFTAGSDGFEWYANVRKDDPELRLYRARWRTREVGVVRVVARRGTSPILMLGLDAPGDDSQTAADVKAGWRFIDRGVLERNIPLDDPDIHLDDPE